MTASPLPSQYEQEVLRWQADRDAAIRRENTWLALAGLFWLNEGDNSIGSDPESDIKLPERLPAHLGSIYFDGKQAKLRASREAGIKINGEAAHEEVLQSDVTDEPSFITVEAISMVLIQRASGTGIRLWDNLRSERRLFPPREWFPVNEALHLQARYILFDSPHVVMLPNVFGEMEPADMHGQVVFEIGGQPYSLDATEEDDGTLTIHFQDLTNRDRTYPSGRYLDTAEPPSEGQVIVDFNYARNPPCAFTPYATCSFAPPGNHLPIAIEAGELYPRR